MKKRVKKATKQKKSRAKANRKEPVEQKVAMTTVWLMPEQMTLLDEICFYIGKNSMGRYRPNRSEILRLLVDQLRGAKRHLKRMRTAEELRKAIQKGL